MIHCDVIVWRWTISSHSWSMLSYLADDYNVSFPGTNSGDYLNGLGSNDCVVNKKSGYPPKMCQHGQCQIYGTAPANDD